MRRPEQSVQGVPVIFGFGSGFRPGFEALVAAAAVIFIDDTKLRETSLATELAKMTEDLRWSKDSNWRSIPCLFCDTLR